MGQAIIIGIVSFWCGISLLPTLAKINKDKEVHDVSLWMQSVFFIWFSVWIYYGYIQGDWAIVIANTFSWFVNLTIVALYFKYKQKKTAKPPIKHLKPELVPAAVRKFRPISFLSKTQVHSQPWSLANRRAQKTDRKFNRMRPSIAP